MGKYSNLKIGETIKTTNGRLYGPLMIDGKKVFRFQGMASQKDGKTTKQSTQKGSKKPVKSLQKGGKTAKKTVKTSKITRTKKQTGGSSMAAVDKKGDHSNEETTGGSLKRPVSLKTAVQLLRQYYRKKYS